MDVNFESTRTYMHATLVVSVCLIGTTLLMFYQEQLYPYVLLTTFIILAVASKQFSWTNIHQNSLWAGYFWWSWMMYSWIWKHPYGSFLGLITSIISTSIGIIACFQQKTVPVTRFLFIMLLYVPSKQHLFCFMDPWDGFLHVFVFLITYYFQYYTILYLEWNLNFFQHVLASTWIFLVSKWFIPFIGIQWMYYAYELSGKLSAKPPDLEEEIQYRDNPPERRTPPTLVKENSNKRASPPKVPAKTTSNRFPYRFVKQARTIERLRNMASGTQAM